MLLFGDSIILTDKSSKILVCVRAYALDSVVITT